MAVDTTPPTVDVRARLRQVPVQELVLPVVIIALIIVGVIIRPGVFLTSDNLLNVPHPGQHHRRHRHRHDVRDRHRRHRPVSRVGAGRSQHRGRAAGSSMAPGCSCSARSASPCSSARSTVWPSPWAKVVPFIATLAMLTIARGWLCGCPTRPHQPDRTRILQSFGSGRILGVPASRHCLRRRRHRRLGVTQPHTTFGRRAVAVGGNRSAARIAGIRPGRVHLRPSMRSPGCALASRPSCCRGRLASASPVVGQPGRAGRDRCRGHRRDRSDRRQGHRDRHLLRRHHLRPDLQPAEPAQHARRDPGIVRAYSSSSPWRCSAATLPSSKEGQGRQST